MGILSTAELRGFYAEYVAAWNRRDMERYESELAALPDLTIECQRLLVDEGTQTLAAENLERGTHSGDMVVGGERLAPTGRKLELRGGLFLTLDEDGRIAEMSEYIRLGQDGAPVADH